MTTTLRWIGSLPSALQAGLDRAVSAELHAITSGIRRSKIAGTFANDTADVSAREPAAATGAAAAPSGRIAA